MYNLFSRLIYLTKRRDFFMKKIINYEKDILFKTNIGEICSISLEHDFTVDDGFLVGEFIISGDYKPNILSLNKEAFNYQLPLEYELEDNVDIATLSYDIENFEYNVKDDELSVFIDFGIRYEECSMEPTIPEISEEDLDSLDFDAIELPAFVDRQSEVEIDGDNIETKVEEEEIETEKPVKVSNETRLDDEEKELILESTMMEDEYITYHVHIVREGDTLDSIAKEYGTSIEIIKAYNNTEALELKTKIIIPEEKCE